MSRQHRTRLTRAHVLRALMISAVVGTLLLWINHGDHLCHGPRCPHFFLKAVGCYLVPLTVSLCSVLLSSGDGGP